MTQQAFDFTGEELSQAGQQVAIDHADAKVPQWSERAYDLVKVYVRAYGSIPFKAEDVRSYAAEIDFPLPPHARAWGGIFTRARTEGIIRSAGTIKVKNKKAHSCYATLWVRATN